MIGLNWKKLLNHGTSLNFPEFSKLDSVIEMSRVLYHKVRDVYVRLRRGRETLGFSFPEEQRIYSDKELSLRRRLVCAAGMLCLKYILRLASNTSETRVMDEASCLLPDEGSKVPAIFAHQCEIGARFYKNKKLIILIARLYLLRLQFTFVYLIKNKII